MWKTWYTAVTIVTAVYTLYTFLYQKIKNKRIKITPLRFQLPERNEGEENCVLFFTFTFTL
jgi:hypothetical protein